MNFKNQYFLLEGHHIKPPLFNKIRIDRLTAALDLDHSNAKQESEQQRHKIEIKAQRSILSS